MAKTIRLVTAEVPAYSTKYALTDGIQVFTAGKIEVEAGRRYYVDPRPYAPLLPMERDVWETPEEAEVDARYKAHRKVESLKKQHLSLPPGSFYQVAKGNMQGPWDEHLPCWCAPVESSEGIWTPFATHAQGTEVVVLWRILIYPTRKPTPMEELAEVGHELR